ncbi:J domain-containing protein [Marinobacter bohaiensis]|uniref:J domain-containing protein n=1 Tax=Marinobacter bohaiensis TaxID=2201898 RepID=UPI000DADECD4|nr:J domain-containing protein [Marinobacter bohaiensis]
MTCWEVLGITPTNNRDKIEQAYQSQRKFADGEAQQQLDDAYRQALREAGFAVEPAASEPAPEPRPTAKEASEQPLSGRDQQVVREVVIQVEAMLNDDQRRKDANLWRAILTEPPADQDAIREAVSDALYPRLRPMLDDGSLPQPVLAFLSQWFGWEEVDQSLVSEDREVSDPFHEPGRQGGAESGNESPPAREKRQPMPNFLPAVIGWIAGLVILTSIFSHLLGN